MLIQFGPSRAAGNAVHGIDFHQPLLNHAPDFIGRLQRCARRQNDIQLHRQQQDRFEAAARTFGTLTARAHLLGASDPRGPRTLFHEVLGQERKFMHHLLGFAVAYTERVMEDFEEVCGRAGEIRKAWKVRAE
jgi:hypothetical protein